VSGTEINTYRIGGKNDNYWCVTATRLHTFSCTSVMPTRKALQTEITMICVIMLSAPHKKLPLNIKINYDITSVEAFKTSVAHMALL
jgi:hypothetical protein